jgi:transposase
MKRAAPSDIEALRAALAVAEARADEAEARAARMVAEAANAEAIIAALKLMIEKLRRELYGQRSERKARLLDQLELKLEELEASATEDELAAEQAAARTTTLKAFMRKRPSRKPFPAHLPRERVVIEAPETCGCCGSDRLRKLGEDVTETLEAIPRRWKVIQTVREKFSCRDCETISQPPATFHATPRGWAGPSLLAMVLFEKYGQHQPLNRQSERYGREGVELSLSTLADQVGACAAALRPLHDLIAAHVLAAERLHGRACPPAREAGPGGYDGAGPGQGQGQGRARLGLCARRRAVRRDRSAGGGVPLRARPKRRASREASAGLCRDPAGRCVCRVQQAVRTRPLPEAVDRGALLGPRAAQVLCPGRHRREGKKGPAGRRHLAAGLRGGAAD